MDDSAIMRPEDYQTKQVIRNGERIASSDYKDVYIDNNRAVKVYFNEDPYSMQRLGTYLPQNLMPETVVREEDLSELEDYHGEYTVVHQEASDQINCGDKFTADSLDKRLQESENFEELGDLVYILDTVVDNDAVITDPIMENFNYFDDSLKPCDICDIESVKHFPESFEPNIAKQEYSSEIENMYEDAITSAQHHTGLELETTSEIFRETSSKIKNIEIIEEGLLTLPKVEIQRQTDRF